MKFQAHRQIGTFRQLEILLAVYERGSVTAAAEDLYLTQPSISTQLKKLTDTLGMPLYEQIGRKLHFTAAGKEVVASAREIFGTLEHLQAKLSDLRGLKAGTLKLAVVTTAKYFVPHVLGPFCNRYPAIEVQLTVGNRSQILARVENNQDDLYLFSHPPGDLDIEAVEFLPNPLVVIAPTGHPLAGRKRIPFSKLSGEAFLMRETGSGTRHAIEQFLQNAGLNLNTKMTIESNEAIKHSVMAGLGISILSEHTLAFGGSSGLVRLDIQQFPIEHYWYLVYLRQKQFSVIAQTFLDYLLTEGKNQLLRELMVR
ncbi:MAG: LysR family transcriptional regulator [Gammaproteobacteria bacterium]|nr:LysR family transcriptional regulator [Gammaproteobacteria bacterium]